MMHARILYAMVKADFLERVRRYSFLLTLGFAVWLGYMVYAGQVSLQLARYRGVNNSAWIGSVIGLVATVWLSLIGFYVVKNSIQRDRETQVGQILATTPMSKAFYTLAKTLSNFAVLAVMVLILAGAALVVQLVQGQGGQVNFATLLAPVLVFGFCALAVTSALAVVFESLPVLRGGVGNILYFFLWIALVAFSAANLGSGYGQTPRAYYQDFTGIASVMGQMEARVRAIDPLYHGGSSFSVGGLTPTTRTFVWEGLDWNAGILLSRLMWLGVALGLSLLAAVFFDRFDPARGLARTGRKRSEKAGSTEEAISFGTGQIKTGEVKTGGSVTGLTPLVRGRVRARFLALVLAEFRLMIRGQGWWWYAVAAGLFVACVASPIGVARSQLILAAWLWPTLLWSQMGTREARFSTQSLIFSAQRIFPRQLLAVWVAGVLVALLTGGGLGLHLALARDWEGMVGWLSGALFIPAIALAFGVWTESRKPFEALYVAWWYVGPLHHIPRLDFMGTTVASSTPMVFLAACGILLLGACCWRGVRLAYA